MQTRMLYDYIVTTEGKEGTNVHSFSTEIRGRESLQWMVAGSTEMRGRRGEDGLDLSTRMPSTSGRPTPHQRACQVFLYVISVP